MERFKLWDKQSNVAILGDTVLTPDDLYQMHPHIARTSGVLLEYVTEDTVGGIDSLDILKEIFGIEPGLSDEEAAAQIIDLRLNPPVVPMPEPVDVEQLRADTDYLLMMMGE